MIKSHPQMEHGLQETWEGLGVGNTMKYAGTYIHTMPTRMRLLKQVKGVNRMFCGVFVGCRVSGNFSHPSVRSLGYACMYVCMYVCIYIHTSPGAVRESRLGPTQIPLSAGAGKWGTVRAVRLHVDYLNQEFTEFRARFLPSAIQSSRKISLHLC